MNNKDFEYSCTASPPPRWRWILRAWRLAVVLLLLASTGRAEAEDTWLFSPYRVNVWISYGPSVRITRTQQADVKRVLRARIGAWAKSTWDLTIPAVPLELRADVMQSPRQMTFKEIQAALEPKPIPGDAETGSEEKKTAAVTEPPRKTVLDGDKLFVVSVVDDGTRFRVQARELDCRALSWSRTSERELGNSAQLGDAVFSAIAEAFAPVVRFSEFRTIGYQNEAGQEKSREVLVGTLRAAGLMYQPKAPAPPEEQESAEGGQQPVAEAEEDPVEKNKEGVAEGGAIGATSSLTDQFEIDSTLPGYIGEGMVMRAVVRRDDRYGRPLEGGITEVVASYVFVQKLNPTGNIECKVYATGSLAKNPVRARSSSRTHKYGLLVRPTAQKTNLKLVDRDRPGRGLEGYTVFSKTPQFPGEENFHIEEADPRTLGQTDWRGIIPVDRLATQIRIIYVRNGQQILARIPIVPGLEDVHMAMLPSDDLRLQVEAFIVGFQLSVMDVVIQRKVLATRVRAKLKEQQVDEAQQIHEQFRNLPSKSDLEKRLQDRQRDFTGGSIDKWSRAKIDALFSRTRLLMDNYIDLNLDAELIREVPQTAEEAAASAAERAAQPAGSTTKFVPGIFSREEGDLIEEINLLPGGGVQWYLSGNKLDVMMVYDGLTLNVGELKWVASGQEVLIQAPSGDGVAYGVDEKNNLTGPVATFAKGERTKTDKGGFALDTYKRAGSE